MAILLPPLSGTSEVRNQFLAPLRAVYHQATTIRNCPAESDWDWLSKGVDRVLSNVRSGRDFLQTFQMFWRREVQVGPYFETLSSDRRLGMVAECSGWLRRRVEACRPSPLSSFESLASFDLYAGDGHYLEQATQDPMMGETRWPTGHFFALNLKTDECHIHAAWSRSIKHIDGHLSGASIGARNFLSASAGGNDRRKWGKLLRRA